MNDLLRQSLADQTDAMIGTAAQSTDRVIEGAVRAAPALHDLAASAQDLVRSSADAVRERADAVRERALRARDTGADFVRERPMQALMIAAAAGAALVLLGRFVTRRGHLGARR